MLTYTLRASRWTSLSQCSALYSRNQCNYWAQNFSCNVTRLVKKTQFPPRPTINEDDIEEVFIKGGGKGGQKINKTSSKVQLKHIPTGIVVSSQFSRSREANRKKAREILALKIEDLQAPPGESRIAILAEHKINKARKKKSKSKKKYAEREAQARALLNGELEKNDEAVSDENDLEVTAEAIDKKDSDEKDLVVIADPANKKE